MAQQNSGTGTPVWLGQASERPEMFGGGKLWIGQHIDDQDILVLDPAETDPAADVLTLYSLTQHRTRRFPRATALQRIQALTDEIAEARAKKEYAQRQTLRTQHQQELVEENNERKGRQRDGVIAAHRKYVEALGLDYQGVAEPGSGKRMRQASKCHVCGIVLDDFMGVVCGICSTALCSCGACACGKQPQRR